MKAAEKLFSSTGLLPPLGGKDAGEAVETLSQHFGMAVYPASVTCVDGIVICVGKDAGMRKIGVVGRPERIGPQESHLGKEVAAARVAGHDVRSALLPPDHATLAWLRAFVPFAGPKLVGVRKSIGCGDRLGIATPAHIRAVRGSGVVPYFAQQSIREMKRTGRTAREVMDDAVLGVLQEGYRDGFGSDADHLKETADIDVTVEAGFTMYTIDPGEHVNTGGGDPESPDLEERFEGLPWETLESTPKDCLRALAGAKLPLKGRRSARLEKDEVMAAALKYGGAVAHTVRMARHLETRLGRGAYELEMSVDETDSPTTGTEHFYVASELLRLGIRPVSIAPRFVGTFEKGVDYKGNLEAFEKCFADHVAIAKALGPYKVSIHSGSDKFSIYPAAARLGGELVHVKTAGTSYLEGLRALAGVDPDLFREILGFAFEHFVEDRASYLVSADPGEVPRAEKFSDKKLPTVLDLQDGRQLLHVTYGSVLLAKGEDGRPLFRDRLLEALRLNEEAHDAEVTAHMAKHVRPFRSGRAAA
jgi:hypothetical protein